MGSSAFTGAVDTILYFENISGKRYITSEGRGTVNFNRQPLIYNNEMQCYIMGEKDDF